MFHSSKNFNLLRFQLFLLLASLTVINTNKLQAETLSLTPPSSIQIGIGANINRTNVNDEQGPTKNKLSLQPVSLFINDWFIYKSRYLVELYFSKHAFEAEENTTGLEANNKGIRFSTQFNLEHSQYFSPWYGMGFDFSQGKYTKRHKIKDGFSTGVKYREISNLSVNLIFNIMQTWPIAANINLGAKFEYRLPLTQAINGFSGSIILLYHPEF